jgi:hypothetical protein
MTVERRIVVGIADIKLVHLKCKCGTERVFLTDALMGVEGRCSNSDCKQPWTTDDAARLKRYLEDFHRLRVQPFPSLEIGFEFTDPA